MKVILIKVDSSMEEINVDDINILSTSNDIQLLYYWNYNNWVINCYGNYINNNSIISNHKLPAGGISNVINDDSYTYDIYGNIYLACFQNNKMINYYISEYGNFHYIMNESYNIYDIDDISDEEVIDTDIMIDTTILQNISTTIEEYNLSEELNIDNNIY